MKTFVVFYLCTYIYRHCFAISLTRSIVFCSKIIKYQILHLFSSSTCFITLSTSNELAWKDLPKNTRQTHGYHRARRHFSLEHGSVWKQREGPSPGPKATGPGYSGSLNRFLGPAEDHGAAWHGDAAVVSRTQKGPQKTAANWERILRGIFTSSNNVNRTVYNIHLNYPLRDDIVLAKRIYIYVAFLSFHRI